MNESEYVSPFKIRKRFDITSNTLRSWAEAGKIGFIRINEGKGKRLYNINDVNRVLGTDQCTTNKPKTICYARVSSDHQKDDLNRQIELLRSKYPNAEIIKEIASGLNFKREGLETLLEQVYTRSISEVVVTYKDRLCRFGIELVEWIFKKHNVKLVVLNQVTETEGSPYSELATDLLSITNFFVAKTNGTRSANYRKERNKEGIKEKNKKQTFESKQPEQSKQTS
jgi:predicted site-specific integrase-resolvase